VTRKVLAILGAALLLAGPARADKVSYTFTGQILGVQDAGGLLPGTAKGSTFTGKLLVDDSVPDTSPLPTNGEYEQTSATLRVLIDGKYDLGIDAAGGSFQAYVNDFSATFPEDSLLVMARRSTGTPSAFNPSVGTVEAQLYLSSTTNPDAIKSDALKGLEIDLSKFEVPVLTMAALGPGGARAVIDGKITSFTRDVEAPEPGAAILAATGACGLLAGWWRRRVRAARARAALA
jgi:hypothetical protein